MCNDKKDCVTINNVSQTIIDVVCKGVEADIPAIYAGLDTDTFTSSVEDDQLTAAQLFKILGGFSYVATFVKADSKDASNDFAIDPHLIYEEAIDSAGEYIDREYERKKKMAELEELEAKLKALKDELGIKVEEAKEVEEPKEATPAKSMWTLGGGTCVFRDPETGEWKRIPTEERTEIIVNYLKDGYSKEEVMELLHIGESVIRHSIVSRRDEINTARAQKRYPLIGAPKHGGSKDAEYRLRMGKRWYEDVEHTGCTYADLAKRYGVSNATVSKYIKAYVESINNFDSINN